MGKRKQSKSKRGQESETLVAVPPLLRWLPSIAVGAAFLIFGVRFFGLISDYAVNIFFSDQWDFNNATLFEHHSLWQIFTWQHGPCRLGVGTVLARLVEPLFRWNSRTESFFLGGLIAVAALCALWLKTRLFGSISYSDAIIPLVFFTALQFETLFVTADLAHGPLPLLLIILYCVAWTFRSLPLRYGLVLAINFLTIYTGFGLFLGFVTPVLLAVDYWANLRNTANGRLYLAVGLLVCLASFGSFFIGYKHQPAVDCFSYQLQTASINYVWFAALMFAPFFGAQGIDDWPTLVGAVVLCALLVALAASAWKLRARSEQWSRYAVVAILTGFCLLFCMGTAYGRLCLGLASAQASRYVVYLNLGILGLYFAVLTISRPLLRNVILAVLGLSLMGSIAAAEHWRPEMARISEMKNGWRKCYLTLGDLGTCNQYARVYPWAPESTHLQEKLDFLKKTRQNLFADSQ